MNGKREGSKSIAAYSNAVYLRNILHFPSLLATRAAEAFFGIQKHVSDHYRFVMSAPSSRQSRLSIVLSNNARNARQHRHRLSFGKHLFSDTSSDDHITGSKRLPRFCMLSKPTVLLSIIPFPVGTKSDMRLRFSSLCPFVQKVSAILDDLSLTAFFEHRSGNDTP